MPTSRWTARDVVSWHVSSAFASGCVAAYHLLCFSHTLFVTVCLSAVVCPCLRARCVATHKVRSCSAFIGSLPLWHRFAEPWLHHCRSFQVRAIARSGSYYVCFCSAYILPLYVHGHCWVVSLCNSVFYLAGRFVVVGFRWGPACALSPSCVGPCFLSGASESHTDGVSPAP